MTMVQWGVSGEIGDDEKKILTKHSLYVTVNSSLDPHAAYVEWRNYH